MKETIITEGVGRVDVSFSERGAGQPVLLLHGGGGPASVTPWADPQQPARSGHRPS